MEPTALNRHNTTLRDSNLNKELKYFDTLRCALVTKVGQEMRKESNVSLKLSFVSSSTTIQYVIFMYMKHLGVRVKEQRNMESKRVRINFLPSKLRVYARTVSICLIFFHTSTTLTLFQNLVSCLAIYIQYAIMCKGYSKTKPRSRIRSLK